MPAHRDVPVLTLVKLEPGPFHVKLRPRGRGNCGPTPPPPPPAGGSAPLAAASVWANPGQAWSPVSTTFSEADCASRLTTKVSSGMTKQSLSNVGVNVVTNSTVACCTSGVPPPFGLKTNVERFTSRLISKESPALTKSPWATARSVLQIPGPNPHPPPLP